jgi:hypothetical protein
MADRTINVTGAFDTPEHHLKTVDLGDSTYAIAASVYNSLVPKGYDYISLSYTGSNLTGVVFKTGGSGGTTVATLTLAYSGSTLTSVTKT